MTRKTLGTIALAGSLLIGACTDNHKKTEQDIEDVPSELFENLGYSTQDVSKEGMANVRYPSKYDNRDRFDENGHLITDNKKEIKEFPVDSLIDEDMDSLDIDSINIDSLDVDSLRIDTANTQELINEEHVRPKQELINIQEKTKGEVYITIDDGPGAYTQEIAEELHKRGHRATFFLVGNNINEKRYEAMRKAAEMGHEFGNHSFSHPNFRRIGIDQAKDQLEKTEQRIKDAGVTPAPYFRFPYGNSFSNEKLFDAYMKGMGYEKVFWNIDTRDWNKSTTKKDLIRCLEKVKPGDVILIHERVYTKDKTIPVIDSVLNSKRLKSVPYRKK